MNQSLSLAQQHLYTFRACPRRFYLRYLIHVPWPEAPLGSELELAYERGRRFHRWVERYLLGLPVESAAETDPVIRDWWSIYLNQGPDLPAGQRYVEAGLTVPIGRHFLMGRFDLLVIDRSASNQARGTIFDWKTGNPRPIERLLHAWQTRVYLAVLAEGGAALADGAAGELSSDMMSMVYWYLEDPRTPRVVAYSQAQHRSNWQELTELVSEIDRQLSVQEWPLTSDWSECRQCPYQAYCGRQAAGQFELEVEDEEEPEEIDLWLEPPYH